ncbi:MAG: hypothetical protein CVV44_19775 [Spirochaetae bacterium HGW-Spirochaetae-1]|jgi:hypothetical protein|nr:MAG: hypothetical protein CVV44_19775 [Spirochaetae bacterium HGW-Spirochaetae-1]
MNHSKFELTKHAADVIEERQISLKLIERVIDNPGLIIPDMADNDLEHLLLKIEEYDNRILRVIINRNYSPLKVITAYYDRTMRGKL